MAYFRNLPNVYYPSLESNKSSSHDYVLLKNLFKYARIPEEVLAAYSAFEYYQIVGDDRPDRVAEKYYNNPGLDWLILVTNQIQNVRDEWPLPQSTLYSLLLEKYTESELEQVKFYETTEIRNNQNHIILNKGIRVSQSFVFRYIEDGILKTANPVTAITNLEYEVQKNDEKRSIILLRPEYVSAIEKDLRNVFLYQKSSEFVDERTIRVNSPCIL